MCTVSVLEKKLTLSSELNSFSAASSVAMFGASFLNYLSFNHYFLDKLLYEGKQKKKVVSKMTKST
jgi:hypothetical protein